LAMDVVTNAVSDNDEGVIVSAAAFDVRLRLA
jgi:hypothetical protein